MNILKKEGMLHLLGTVTGELVCLNALFAFGFHDMALITFFPISTIKCLYSPQKAEVEKDRKKANQIDGDKVSKEGKPDARDRDQFYNRVETYSISFMMLPSF